MHEEVADPCEPRESGPLHSAQPLVVELTSIESHSSEEPTARSLERRMEDWQIQPHDLQICRHPDGRYVELGTGAFGKVGRQRHRLMTSLWSGSLCRVSGRHCHAALHTGLVACSSSRSIRTTSGVVSDWDCLLRPAAMQVYKALLNEVTEVAVKGLAASSSAQRTLYLREIEIHKRCRSVSLPSADAILAFGAHTGQGTLVRGGDVTAQLLADADNAVAVACRRMSCSSWARASSRTG